MLTFGFHDRGRLDLFIGQRLDEHRRIQHHIEHDLMEEIIEEIQALPRRQPKFRRMCGKLFEEGMAVER